MAFAVRQWPKAPDPRSSLYSFAGWDWGQVVSSKWIVSSTGATGAWSFLNDGFIVGPKSDDGSLTIWEAIVPDSGGTIVGLEKTGHEAPVGSPPFTIAWFWRIDVPSTGESGSAFEQLVFPKAIRVFGPLVMLDSSLPIPDLPNPVTITPAIWDLETP